MTFAKEFLDKILKEKNILLPDDFYNYLTQISHEHTTQCNIADLCEPLTYNKTCNTILDEKLYDKKMDWDINSNEDPYNCLEITDLPTDEMCQGCIPENVTDLTYYFPEIRVHENDVAKTVSHDVNASVTDGFFEIGSIEPYNSQTYNIYLGQGSHFGSIWLNMDDTCYGECPMYSKQYDTFTEYLDKINNDIRNC
jgi:hypothetical protein